MNSKYPERFLPSFLVVGPPRTGTSWLHEVLTGNANLPRPTKETRFFDLHFDRGLEWYRSHFRGWRHERVTGEVAPTYFASELARERIAQTLPEVKLVFIFRQPVERIVSLYRLKSAYGMVRGSLEKVLERDPELLESSRYASLLERWQQSFPAHNLSVHFYEDLKHDPQGFVDEVTTFLQMPRISVADARSGLQKAHSSVEMSAPRSYLATRAATATADWLKAFQLDDVVRSVRESRWGRLLVTGGPPFQEVAGPTLQRISELVRPEVERLEAMVERDLSGWKEVPQRG